MPLFWFFFVIVDILLFAWERRWHIFIGVSWSQFCYYLCYFLADISELIYVFKFIGLIEISYPPEFLEKKLHQAKNEQQYNFLVPLLKLNQHPSGYFVLASQEPEANIEEEHSTGGQHFFVDYDLPFWPLEEVDGDSKVPGHVDDKEGEGGDHPVLEPVFYACEGDHGVEGDGRAYADGPEGI